MGAQGVGVMAGGVRSDSLTNDVTANQRLVNTETNNDLAATVLVNRTNSVVTSASRWASRHLWPRT
jgi:hypothetical protein